MKITTIKLTEEKIQKLGDVFNELSAGNAYLIESIYPKLERLTESLHDQTLLKEYAKGSYLAYAAVVQESAVIRHCYIAWKGNFFAIAETKKELYGFLVNTDRLVQFCALEKSGFKRDIIKDSVYVGKPFGEIADIFRIPTAENLLYIYAPTA